MYDNGIRGRGETVAVIMDSDVSRDDLKTFENEMGIRGVPDPDVESIPVTPVPADNDPTEATLDVETVRMIAPEAKILLYIAPLKYFSAALDRVVADQNDPKRQAHVVNWSAGGCSEGDTSEYRADRERALQAAVNARPTINVFISAGDFGVYDCMSPNTDPPTLDWSIAVDWPSSSPNAISVGGTYLERDTAGGYLDETAWENPLRYTGGGGGNDPLAQRPKWQQGPGVQNPLSSNPATRQVPDVSAPADGTFIWPIVVQGKEELVGGTSAASPFWAGLAALYGQLAKRAGINDLGMLNKAFYAVAAANQQNPVFHDIVRGANLGYNATPGWDYATGLGSPIADRLGAAIVDYLHNHGNASAP